MYNKNKMQYVVKTCSGDDVQDLQNLLNEMSNNGWELYSMQEVESDEGFVYNCIFMAPAKSVTDSNAADEINISTFKSQMEKMLSPKLTPYESCLEIQSKIRTQKEKIRLYCSRFVLARCRIWYRNYRRIYKTKRSKTNQ